MVRYILWSFISSTIWASHQKDKIQGDQNGATLECLATLLIGLARLLLLVAFLAGVLEVLAADATHLNQYMIAKYTFRY